MIFAIHPRILSAHRRRGMTLVELMVATALAAIVFTIVGALVVYTSRSCVALGNYNGLDEASQNALDTLSREIRMTRQLAPNGYSQSQLTFVDWDGQTNLTYKWNPPAGNVPGSLVRIKGTT